MTEEEIKKLLFAALTELFEIEAEKITLSSNLYEDLDIDSIDAIDLIDYIQKQTGYKVRAEDFRAVRTVEDVIQAVIKIQNSSQV
ncbi:MAG: acyl carrier protein [Cardiobacteriaceae bacterium]|nr:acyl carrier protein [Cardiobacteriaceae bacterium]